ncbi:sensor histidine kinase [Nocardioides okcheonensis]|uniref:sensor histidine kinase n=1 Tax=Nocardioides okcheonensis TaxID=2894081 RepID=UPI001E61FB69|nr:HAMP domain-containing sensor histidine kinase [Nocardioides okcheonensis]UFN42640.1 HAMP domain-containing histidine kinase [Nocardioides okcheonensis]
MHTTATNDHASATDQPWSDEQTRQHLQVLVEGVAVLAGFEQSAISLRRGDEFEVVAGAGEGVVENIVGRRLPHHVVEGELAKADHWDAWRFVPHDRVGDEVLEYSHVPAAGELDAPDAWHPLDLLTAPVYDDDGVLRGLLSVDGPRDGRRPGADQLALLQKYAGLARTSVLLALEREDLSRRVRLADEARQIVRRALGEPTLDQVLAACRSAVTECFGAVGMWLTAFDEDGGDTTAWYAVGTDAQPVFSDIDDVVLRLAHRYWADQHVAHFSRARSTQPGLPSADAERLLTFLEGIGVGSVLFVPMGAGPQCLGFLALSRVSDTPAWTDMEKEAALDIGRDLGHAVANARALDAERALVEELRRLDGYRVSLVNTLAHELRTPLFSISANLELVESDQLGEEDRRCVAAAVRGTTRMRSVVDDLLTMAAIADPQREFVPEQVDLRQVLLEVAEECQPAAQARSQNCRLDVPETPVLVAGRPEELHRMFSNLSSNAIKYSDDGADIDVRLVEDSGEVRISVTDSGLGISEEDQARLFQEFFRSTNPDATSRPGTGLGLAIVERIVRRHSGRIDIESKLGIGTTMTVVLPRGTDTDVLADDTPDLAAGTPETVTEPAPAS